MRSESRITGSLSHGIGRGRIAMGTLSHGRGNGNSIRIGYRVRCPLTWSLDIHSFDRPYGDRVESFNLPFS